MPALVGPAGGGSERGAGGVGVGVARVGVGVARGRRSQAPRGGSGRCGGARGWPARTWCMCVCICVACVRVCSGDHDRPLVLRLCHLPNTPDAVPFTDATFELPTSAVRRKMVDQNPAAAAEYFCRLIRTLFRVLLQLSAVDERKKWCVNVRPAGCTPGIFGPTLGFICVIE